MKYRIPLLLSSSSLVLQINSSHSSMIDTGGPSLRALNRVDQLDKTDAICEAKITDVANAPTGVTHIAFYYSVESSEPVTYTTIQNLDRMLYYAIGDAVLWCSQNASADDNGRRLQVHESNPKSKFCERERYVASIMCTTKFLTFFFMFFVLQLLNSQDVTEACHLRMPDGSELYPSTAHLVTLFWRMSNAHTLPIVPNVWLSKEKWPWWPIKQTACKLLLRPF